MTGTNRYLPADKVLLIEDDRMQSISDTLPDTRLDQVIDLASKVIMPGLTDCHFHAYATDANFHLLETLPQSHVAQCARPRVESALRRGFTTIRDAGGADYGLWRAIQKAMRMRLTPAPQHFL